MENSKSKQRIRPEQQPPSAKGLTVKKQFTNRFKGKQDFVTKDGHYGVVSNTKNPIQKGLEQGNPHEGGLIQNSRNPQLMENSAYNDNIGASGSFGPMQQN